MNTSLVEAALGWDNYVVGVRVGLYVLNNAPILPIAVQEMRREYNDGSGFRDRGGDIADAVQTVLFRHLGRRKEMEAALQVRAGSFGSCLATGWASLAGIPISILSAFGLLDARKARAARQSVLFRVWSLVTALATVAGPTFAYLADREKIDATIRAFLH